VRIQVFWNVMVYWWAGVYQCFEGTHCLHLQGLKGQNHTPLTMKRKHSVKIKYWENSTPVAKCHIIPKEVDPQKHLV